MRISSPNTSRRSAELTLFFSSFWKVKLMLSGFPLNLCNKKNQNYILGIFFLVFFLFPSKQKEIILINKLWKAFFLLEKYPQTLSTQHTFFFPQKYLFKWYLFQLMDFNLWKSETSNYIFMVLTDSLGSALDMPSVFRILQSHSVTEMCKESLCW